MCQFCLSTLLSDRNAVSLDPKNAHLIFHRNGCKSIENYFDSIVQAITQKPSETAQQLTNNQQSKRGNQAQSSQPKRRKTEQPNYVSNWNAELEIEQQVESKETATTEIKTHEEQTQQGLQFNEKVKDSADDKDKQQGKQNECIEESKQAQATFDHDDQMTVDEDATFAAPTKLESLIDLIPPATALPSTVSVSSTSGLEFTHAIEMEETSHDNTVCELQAEFNQDMEMKEPQPNSTKEPNMDDITAEEVKKQQGHDKTDNALLSHTSNEIKQMVNFEATELPSISYETHPIVYQQKNQDNRTESKQQLRDVSNRRSKTKVDGKLRLA